MNDSLIDEGSGINLPSSEEKKEKEKKSTSTFERIDKRFKQRKVRKFIGRRYSSLIGSQSAKGFREKKVRALLSAFGAMPVKQGQARARAGRPSGTYKYNMPIRQYQKLMNERKALRKMQSEQAEEQLLKKGYSPEQIMQIKIQRQVYEENMPEKSFEEVLEENTISPNTQSMLDRLKWVQDKWKRDDLNMQRIKREQRLLGNAGHILKARNLFGPDSAKFNILETKGNILEAPNTFKENPENNVLRPRRFNILNTKEAGNSLFF